ncbi:MAG TPA: hypothetical protein VHG72_14020 [Polyangia bacterium]|nr:hypothetical protein [Polyangia bacterium]
MARICKRWTPSSTRATLGDMNNWMTPFIVRLNRPNWSLSDAVTKKFDCQSVYGRYVKDGYAHYTYELFCVFPRDRVPAEGDKMAILDKIQAFAHGFIQSEGSDDPPESVAE